MFLVSLAIALNRLEDFLKKKKGIKFLFNRKQLFRVKDFEKL